MLCKSHFQVVLLFWVSVTSTTIRVTSPACFGFRLTFRVSVVLRRLCGGYTVLRLEHSARYRRKIPTERETVRLFLHKSRRSWWTESVRPSWKCYKETAKIQSNQNEENKNEERKGEKKKQTILHFSCGYELLSIGIFFAWFRTTATDLSRSEIAPKDKMDKKKNKTVLAFKVHGDWFWHWNRHRNWACLSLSLFVSLSESSKIAIF